MSRKAFKHNFLAVPKLEQSNLESGRVYVGEGFSFPSITTVLSKTKDTSFLRKWKAKVGEEAAARITSAANRRGTAMHSLCERYLLNEDLGTLGYTQGELLFRAIRQHLDEFEEIRALETRLFSKRLKVAGSVDCVAVVGGVLTVIDFKTSSKEKQEEYIEDYFLQGCFYLNAFWELSGDLPRQVRILIALENGSTQVFDLRGSRIVEYTKLLEQRIESYYANKTE